MPPLAHSPQGIIAGPNTVTERSEISRSHANDPSFKPRPPCGKTPMRPIRVSRSGRRSGRPSGAVLCPAAMWKMSPIRKGTCAEAGAIAAMVAAGDETRIAEVSGDCR